MKTHEHVHTSGHVDDHADHGHHGAKPVVHGDRTPARRRARTPRRSRRACRASRGDVPATFLGELGLSIPIVVTSHMVMDWFGYELDFSGMTWVGPVLGSVVFFWGGWPFLEGGWREIRARQPGMMLLIAMAIIVAYGASLATSLDAFELDFWWELSLLVTIMLLGHWQEMKALGQAQDALAALAGLLPDEAERVGDDGQVETVALDALAVGDVVLVRSGARVPADGQIVEGSAELDESMITGESKPVAKAVGDQVVAGTVSTDSAIRVRVDAVGEDTTLAGIQRLVAEAQESRSRAQVLADRAAALLFYVATGAAVITGIVWLALGDPDEAVVRVVTVLVISCPHALGLAIPLTTSLSSAIAARNGILVKDRLALEQSRTIDAFLFDKTGTLTGPAQRHRCRRRRGHRGRGAAARRRCGVRQRTPPRPGDRHGRPSPGGIASRPGSGRSPAVVSKPTSTGSRTRSVDRRCCGNVNSANPKSCPAGRRGWRSRGAAVLYLVRATGSSEVSPSKTRSAWRHERR